MSRQWQNEILVIGSGAGGATTALELAARGRQVLMVEEGQQRYAGQYGQSPPEAMRLFYRRRGMVPVLGTVPMGYVEGCCLGGSTEINSGFWHRTPPEILLRWKAQFDLAEASPEQLAPHFEWAEEALGVTLRGASYPPSTVLFERGIGAMGWSAQEVPRAATGCEDINTCPQGCPSGAKKGMSRSLIPRARELGVRVLTGCRVERLLLRGRRVQGIVAWLEQEDGSERQVRIDADHVFVCCGPTETPALLRRSGIKLHVGNSLRVHPMLKVAALFDQQVEADQSVLPLLQVKEFWPDIALGGSYFTRGYLAMQLSDNWPLLAPLMKESSRMALFYVAARGVGRGSVRPSLLDERASVIRYDVTRDDIRNLSTGLGRLCSLLLAAGARAVYPGVHGIAPIGSRVEAVRWLDELLPRSALNLTTVHGFSSCPMGERVDRCAADSYGRVYNMENLYINDASLLPDSPGVNPQGSVMVFARRNAQHFAEEGPR